MIVDRYLSREIVKYSLTGLLVFTFSFMTGKIFRVTEMVLDRGIPFFYALKFMLLLTPSFLVFVIPMALLLGVLLALSRMSADREVLALKTSGVGAQRFLRPVLAVALVATLSTGFLTLYGVPWSIRAFKESLFEAASKALKPRIREKVFHNLLPGVVIYVDEIHEGRMRGVLLYDEREAGQHNLIVAQEGLLAVEPKGRKLSLRLFKGEIHQEAEGGTYRVAEFEHYTLNLAYGEMLEAAKRKSRVRLLEKEMSTRELKEKIQRRKEEGKDIRPQLVELHFKFAIPFAALVLGFLGLPLGTYHTRSGRSFGFVISLFVILLYYILYCFGKALATGGLIPPWAGAWFPNGVLLALGIYLFRKSLEESPVLLLELMERGLEALRRMR